MTTATTLEHEPFCQPRIGEDGPRIETFTADRTGADGITVVSRARVVRCVECGAQTVQG